jgi:hypothetical protein
MVGAFRSTEPHKPIESWTSGHGHDHDTQFAKQIARISKSKHTSIDIPQDFISLFGPDYAHLLDGSVSADGSHRATLIPYVKDSDVVFNGFLGDVLCGSNLLERTLDVETVDKAAEIGYRYYEIGFDNPTLNQVLKPEVFSKTGFARESFIRTVRSVNSGHPANRLGYATILRQPWGDSRAQLELLGAHFQLALPFTDTDLLDFILSLPLKYRVGRKAYVQMICQKYPKLARVPRAGDGLPLIHSRLRASLHWKWLSFYRQILPKLTANHFGGHAYWNFVHCDEWFRNSSREFMSTQLINNPVLEPFFKQDALNQLIENYLNLKDARDLSKGISALISFAVFCKNLNSLSSCSLYRKENKLVNV